MFEKKKGTVARTHARRPTCKTEKLNWRPREKENHLLPYYQHNALRYAKNSCSCAPRARALREASGSEMLQIYIWKDGAVRAYVCDLQSAC